LPAECDARIDVDFTRDHDPQAWLPRLRGVDAVINAAGILRERGSQTFASLHVQAPCALFSACAQARVERVVNISALGADENARTAYHVSKRQADEHLRALPLAWTIVQPSLVYGLDGSSARLFNALASAPLLALPAGGRQLLQPVHIDDLAAGIAALLENTATYARTIPFVGPTAISLKEYLAQLRGAMKLGARVVISIPMSVSRAAAALGNRIPGSLLNTATLAMLERGNTADPGPLTRLLGREPLAPARFIDPMTARQVGISSQLSWLLPLLRASLAIVWIVTALVSFGLYPTGLSYRLLARVGVPDALAPVFLYGAAVLDLALGVATLAMRRRRRALWVTQAALILLYTVIITLRLPEFWLHPYGPLVKNLPMLAVLCMLYVLERR
jgi:uncharacterized protein YbjT (DUF2867 family)